MIANRALELMGRPRGEISTVDPNDHVNYGQSTNDTIPTAMRLATLDLVPALDKSLAGLATAFAKVAKDVGPTALKAGRTHLQDAVPMRIEQEVGGWAKVIENQRARLAEAAAPLRVLPIGGTAIGTGINADPRFGKAMAKALSELTGTRFDSASDKFEGLASQDDAVELSGQLNALAVALMKIANDLRWMNSGPLAGLGELELPALQPGSSIMPGKVNPVIPEATCMVCAQVMGHHVAVTVAGQSGNFQLNVMLPLIAHDLLESIGLLANAMRLLADKAIAGLKVREDRVAAALDRNPILVTALNPVIGYEKAAAIAKRAYAEGRPIVEVAREMSGLPEKELRRLLNPAALTRGGVRAGSAAGG